MKMEMPDEIFVTPYNSECDNGEWELTKWIPCPFVKNDKRPDGESKYHHSRIVEALKAENDELKVQNETHKKAYRDLLESWSDLRVKYSIAVDELADIKAKLEKANKCLSQISRMKTFPDNAINTTTLVAAHTIARTTLEEIK